MYIIKTRVLLFNRLLIKLTLSLTDRYSKMYSAVSER